MGDGKAKSVIKRVYVPTQVRDLPNGEKLKIPGHYKAPPSESNIRSINDAQIKKKAGLSRPAFLIRLHVRLHG